MGVPSSFEGKGLQGSRQKCDTRADRSIRGVFK
jgi:hypothetical protein